MSVDHIRYDILTQEALRSVLRRVLVDIAKSGLPGDHHFYISIDTNAPGVRMSPRLRAQYPEEITVVLQHQFWDLAVTDHGFEVGLSFGGVPEHLAVPFDAIKRFFDPSVQFGLQFETVAATGDESEAKDEAAGPMPVEADKAGAAQSRSAQPAAAAKTPTEAAVPDKARTPAEPSPDESGPGVPAGGAEVVRLDRFRKK